MTEQEIADICDMLAQGKSLRAACREMGLNECTARKAFNASPEAYTQYARARELQADALFDDVLDIADKGAIALDSAEDRRIQIDARKWMAGKLKGKYSDKVKHVGGDDGDNPIAFTGFKRQFID